MGRHSRKGPVLQGPQPATGVADGEPGPEREAPGGGRRRRPEPGPGGDEHTGTACATPAHGTPQVRGGHPEQHEPGGGWGSGQRYGDRQGAAPRKAPQTAATPVIPGPRREFVEAFDDDAFGSSPIGTSRTRISRTGTNAFGAPGTAAGTAAGAAPGVFGAPPVPYPPGPDVAAGDGGGGTGDGSDGGTGAGGPGPEARGGKGRAITGIAAAAVTTVLAVVVAGQVAGGGTDTSADRAAGGLDRTDQDDASRSDGRTSPSPTGTAAQTATGEGAPAVATYAQLMTRRFALSPTLTASGTFTAVPGLDRAPGKGKKVRYRVDIEDGLGLDGKLFADAVWKTLNDNRSWAHNGAMTFERISSGAPDFVITLASPGTTGVWCDKSDLDTTIDNVSCDSAATERVMINAWRWAQGAKTFGPKAMLPYRQMLINHEVGHRLGNGHVSCRTPGALAPVMQQQTKTLEIDGIACRPNPWVYPTA
ncbi:MULTISPECIES: DUF3152 domain-containing protein [unclassified Streptomyces]|uniref:DUF3152 domain-containing protein n=1 Tax=unclassified Streptomyces TaxID=2593676 RepID=UPI0037F4CEA6